MANEDSSNTEESLVKEDDRESGRSLRSSIFTRNPSRKRAESLLAALLVLALGVIGSIYDPDGRWFQRSGSLVIVVVVFQVLRWRFSYIRTKELLEISVWALTFGVVLKWLRKKPKLSPEERHKQAHDYASETYKGDWEALETEEIWLWITEAFLIIIGTLVWGFGDLLI